ncbi:MAG: rhodanese-like domain-containing protein [Sulfurospirillum sp.]
MAEKTKNSMAMHDLEEIKKRVFSSAQVKDEDLQELLRYKEEGKFDFKLIDIREIYEYSDRSIDKTDLLYPTTLLHRHIEDLEKIKDEHIILYCRTGNRTEQVLMILKRMGFDKIAHLSEGIIAYSGKTGKNTKLPKNIEEKR